MRPLIVFLLALLFAGQVLGQEIAAEAVMAIVEDIIFDSIAHDSTEEDPAVRRKWVRAKEKIVELGAAADMALAGVIVKSLPLKRQASIVQEERKKNWRNNPAEESRTVHRLDELVLLARDDPKLVPILYRPMLAWWDGFATGAPFSFTRTEEEVAIYLYKWGDEAMRKRLLEQVEQLKKSPNFNVSSMAKRLEKEMVSPDDAWVWRPKGPFHEWCREWLQRRIANLAANDTGMEAPGPQIPPPQLPPKQPDPSTPTPNQPQPGHKDTTAWVIGLVVVLVGVGWVYRRRWRR